MNCGCRRHPRPCVPGCDPLRVSPLPLLGTLSLSPPLPVSYFRIILPASGNGANIVPVLAVRHHRSRASATVVAFVFRRSGCACVLAAPFGEGIGSIHLRLQAFTLCFAPVHSFRLRLRSPMPGERRTENDAGTYRNPSPRPPPAAISGRGSRSHALELVPIVAIQPLLAALTTLSFCLGPS